MFNFSLKIINKQVNKYFSEYFDSFEDSIEWNLYCWDWEADFGFAQGTVKVLRLT